MALRRSETGRSAIVPHSEVPVESSPRAPAMTPPGSPEGEAGASGAAPRSDTANWREELRREYAQALPDKLSRIADLFLALEQAPADKAALEALLMAVHRLHGSAGSYGFQEVSRTSGDWELELREARTAGLSPAALLAMRERLRALRGVPGPDLPLTPEEADAAGALLLGLRAALGREPRVLLVEDDPDMAALLAGVLASLQIGCELARGTDEALTAFAGAAFDFVVSDYRFAQGTARTLVHALRARDPEMPILIVSGQVDRRELLDLIRESVDEVQEKPLDGRAFTGAVVRLLLLGEERRRTRRRGAALLALSSQVRLGMAGPDLLSLLARVVPEITPFRGASVALIDQTGRGMLPAATHGAGAGDAGLSLDELRARHERGFRLDVAAFVPGDQAGANARHGPWRDGDQVLVEIRSGARLLGYLAAGSPLDGRRPSDDSLRMLALLGHEIAGALDNHAIYASQMRLNFQLRFSRELVRAALGTTDVETLKPMLTSAAVNGLGGSFAAFAELTSRGWRLSDVACRRTEDCPDQIAPGAQAESVFARVERTGQAFHWRAADGAVSLAGRRSTQALLAVPIRADDVLRYVLLVEEDERGEFEEVTLRAYVGLCDQVGLILSRLHYQKYLETTAAELRESHGRLRAEHAGVVRLHELLRACLPASTWKALVDDADARGDRA